MGPATGTAETNALRNAVAENLGLMHKLPKEPAPTAR